MDRIPLWSALDGMAFMNAEYGVNESPTLCVDESSVIRIYSKRVLLIRWIVLDFFLYFLWVYHVDRYSIFITGLIVPFHRFYAGPSTRLNGTHPKIANV